MPLMNVVEYARHRGVSHQAVSQALEGGKIRKERNGKIDSEKADRSWALKSNPVAIPSPNSGRRKSPSGVSVENLGFEDKLDLKTKMAHLREKEARAETAEMERDEKKGLLVKRPAVNEYVAFFTQMVRDHMMAVPDRLAPALAAVNEPAIAHRILKTDIDAGLRKLSKAIVRAGF